MSKLLLCSKSLDRALGRMAKGDVARVYPAIQRLASTGDGDLKALEGPLQGCHWLRGGKCRMILRMRDNATLEVLTIDNCGEAN